MEPVNGSVEMDDIPMAAQEDLMTPLLPDEERAIPEEDVADQAAPSDLNQTPLATDVTPEIAAAYTAVQQEGQRPTYDAVRERLRAMTGHVGSSTRFSNAFKVLQGRDARPPRTTDAIGEAEAQLAAATSALHACLARRQPVEASMEQLQTALADLKKRYWEGEASLIEAIHDKERELWLAQQDLTKQLPPKEAALTQQEQAAYAALHQAQRARALEACHTLAAQRYAWAAPDGPFNTKIDALLEEYATGEALTAAHRHEASLAGVPFGPAPEQMAALHLVRRLMEWIPLPLSRADVVKLAQFRQGHDLAQADGTCQPRSVEELAASVGQGTVMLRWQDTRLPNLASVGVTRDYATQAKFQKREPVEFTLEECAQLRNHYGEESVVAVRHNLW